MRINPKNGTLRFQKLTILLEMGVKSDFIRKLHSYEEYSFSLSDLRQNIKAPESSIWKKLSHLGKNKQILNLRQGFYLILSPQYQHYGKLSVYLDIDKHFKYLQKPFHIGYYSAASYHGGSHQQIHGESNNRK